MDLTFFYLLGIGVFLIAIGYALPLIKSKPFSRFFAWAIIISTTLLTIQICTHESALYRMLAMVSMQLLAMKTIVMIETYSGKPKLNFVQWIAFAQGWFGMRPALFESLVSKSLPNVGTILIKGISRILLGFTLLYLSQYIDNQNINAYFLSEFLILVGLSLILHFGILNISTAFWRFCGVNVKELFQAPYKSKSLREFWGKRWNLAFSEMTALIAYKPLKGKFGKNTAMFLSFLLSGILHEIAISLPVKSGYGLPFSYFLIHGLVMYAEGESSWVKKIISHPIISRIWVFAWLILPMPLLFHEKFIHLVIVPLRDSILSMF